MNKTVVGLAIALIMMACGGNETKQNESDENTVVTSSEIEKVDYAVGGMVCAMGCAATIEKEVSEMEGVTVSDVNYEQEKAHFEFDPSVVSEQEIKAKIAAIADGQYVLSKWEEKETEVIDDTEDIEGFEKEDAAVEVSLTTFEMPNLLALLLNQL